MDAFFATFKTYERTIGVNLYSQLKQNAVHAKVRKYPDSIARALDSQQCPGCGVRHADRTDRSEPADAVSLFPPAGEAAGRAAAALLRHLSAARAQRRQAALRRWAASSCWKRWRRWARTTSTRMTYGFDHRWMDTYPRPHKQSGAHMDGLRVRCAPVRADELQRRLRIGHHGRARVGARHALVPRQQGPAIRDFALCDIRRRNRVDVQRAAPAAARAENGEDRRRAPLLPRLRAGADAWNVLPPGDVRRVRARRSMRASTKASL